MTLGKRLSGHTGRNVRCRMRRAWHSGWHGAAFANRRHFLSNKQKTKKHEPVHFNIKLSCKVRIKRMSLFSPPEHRGRARLRQGNQKGPPPPVRNLSDRGRVLRGAHRSSPVGALHRRPRLTQGAFQEAMLAGGRRPGQHPLLSHLPFSPLSCQHLPTTHETDYLTRQREEWVQGILLQTEPITLIESIFLNTGA